MLKGYSRYPHVRGKRPENRQKPFDGVFLFFYNFNMHCILKKNSSKEEKMKRKRKDTRYLASVSLMMAVTILLASTPIGMIQLPVIKATTVHIPVILGAVLLGPFAGALLGGVFGICSMVSNTMAPNLLSFAFSPFMSMTGLSGVIKALWISVGCRILIGLLSGWFWIFLKKFCKNLTIALAVTGFFGSMVNTVTVLESISILFAAQYAQVNNIGIDAVWGLILATVAASGVPEAIVAAILVAVIGKVLLKFVK